MTILRKDVIKKDCWNVSALYPSLKAWEKDFATLTRHTQAPFFPELLKYRSTLKKGVKTIQTVLELYFSLDRHLSKLYTYAHLRHDEDLTNDACKQIYDKIITLYHTFAEEASWLQPELQTLDPKVLNSPSLKEYAVFLKDILRLRPHTLDAAQEQLLALAGQALSAPQRTFSAISDADFRFESVKDKKGTLHPLTHASFSLYLRSPDRVLRKNAFQTLLGHYASYENSFAELLQGQVQKHFFQARARNYSSCVEAALFPHHIEPAVYHALIEAVHDNISTLHHYIKLRKKVLKLKDIHLYDMAVPLVHGSDRHFSYEEAEDLVIASVTPLGPEYQNFLSKGLKTDRWVDRYENQNKRSGAYSSGCYDSNPYILMNYKGILRHVYTLAHEAGHSMHSLFSRKTQPYHYSSYAIFVAEVASTFNEELLMRHLLERATTKAEKAFLINEKLDDIRGTLFRQTMFAEFELFIHQAVEKRIPITPLLLKNEFIRLNQFYFGKEVVIDPEIAIEWARIPHFYYNFYVYQYATGISAAIALTEKLLDGGKKEQQAYLNFLRSGSSNYPIELLKKAGVNMRSPEVVKQAIRRFSTLTNELEKLL